jgi:hypothetical protein
MRSDKPKFRLHATFSLAGFSVSTNGRFGVSAEAWKLRSQNNQAG